MLGGRAQEALLLTIDGFRTQFEALTAGFDWEVEGFLDKQNRVHPIDTDTKVISTVFERFASPVLRSIATPLGYSVETANQTTYPDFTLTSNTGHRIGIDIKTTYQSRSMVFTLGGYNSFLRTNTKNILYPYDTYQDHWIIGFIYQQRPPFQEYDLSAFPSRGDIPCPYDVKAVFVREKYEITGLRAGSGNTKNIGSVKLRNASDFATAKGPFCYFSKGKLACDHYWRNYEHYIPQISTPAQLISHPDFIEFGPKND